MTDQRLIIPKYTRIRDTYTTDEILGAGAFGAVYKVRHKYLGFQALKVFHQGSIPKEQEAELFNEAYILSKITHENVVRVYEANTFEFNGNRHCYIAMEYVDGVSLDKFLKSEVKISSEVAVEIQKGICAGLAQAHKLEPPVVHRDVKPQNVMMTRKIGKLVVKVSDYGLAKHVDPITRLTEAAGTLSYLPPEGFWNYESPASDVFSAGIIFYLMLTGIAPFKLAPDNQYTQKNKIQSVIKESRNRAPDPPSKYNDKLDSELEGIVLKALAPDIKNRYKDADEFLSAIENRGKQKDASIEEEIQRALALGKQYGSVPEAIKLLEHIFSQQPIDKQNILRARYGETIENWKKGVMM